MQVPQPNEGDSGKPIKLLDRVRNRMRVLHLSKRTEEAYVSWISRYVYFHRERRGEWVHPENLIGEDVTHFLTYLAVCHSQIRTSHFRRVAEVRFTIHWLIPQCSLDWFSAKKLFHFGCVFRRTTTTN